MCDALHIHIGKYRYLQDDTALKILEVAVPVYVPIVERDGYFLPWWVGCTMEMTEDGVAHSDTTRNCSRTRRIGLDTREKDRSGLLLLSFSLFASFLFYPSDFR